LGDKTGGEDMRIPTIYLTIFTFIFALIGTISFFSPSASFAQEQQPEGAQVPFFTLRNRTGSSDPERYFGDRRSDLKAGQCEVSSLDLTALGTLADSAPGFVKEEFLRVEQVTEMSEDTLLGALVDSVGTQRPVLYVHGFNISFEKGCRRALLLRENADLDGQFLWFSWPSDGALTNYTRDESDLYWSVPDIAEAMVTLDEVFGTERVNVVGHSLGARGVVLALYEVANRSPNVRLGEVALLAPDMDFEIFARILTRIRPIADSITVYVTEGDRPLALSEQLHGYPRLGEAGNDVSILDGVEVIDISSLPTWDPTGHLYHIYDPALGDDLIQLLKNGIGAAQRPNLVSVGTNLWMLEAPEDEVGE
jgi:esterase/lipase superfamily enzyme